MYIGKIISPDENKCKYKHNTKVFINDKKSPLYLKDGIIISTPNNWSTTYLIKIIELNGIFIFNESQLATIKLKAFV